MNTERLYYTDCYLREFEASVVAAEPAPHGCRVYLDRSAFYPESGGQPSDRGTLGGIPVLDAVDEGDAVAHLVERKPESETVKGAIDWPRRFDHMQQHTGQHVLSAAFEKAGGLKTVSFHLGAETSTIDLDSDRVGRRQIEEAEELANSVVFEDREVRILFRRAGEANQMGLRKPTSREGDVRLIEIEGFDLSACGGTHVKRTGEIGIIAARKIELVKRSTRVEFVCGYRALRSARRDFLNLSEAGRLLSGGADQAPALVAKQSEELRAAVRAREKLAGRMAEYRAAELLSTAPLQNGRRVVRQIFSAEELLEAKMIAHAVAKQPSAVALVAVKAIQSAKALDAKAPEGKGSSTTLFFAKSAGGTADMSALLRQTVTRFGGKGGGARDFAQGGGVAEEKLDEALALAEELLNP